MYSNPDLPEYDLYNDWFDDEQANDVLMKIDGGESLARRAGKTTALMHYLLQSILKDSEERYKKEQTKNTFACYCYYICPSVDWHIRYFIDILEIFNFPFSYGEHINNEVEILAPHGLTYKIKFTPQDMFTTKAEYFKTQNSDLCVLDTYLESPIYYDTSKIDKLMKYV